jgi:hypothetical protein
MEFMYILFLILFIFFNVHHSYADENLVHLENAFNGFDWNKFFDRNTELSNYNQNLILDDMYNRLTPLLLKSNRLLENTNPPKITYNCGNPKYSHILTGKELKVHMKILDFFPFFNELDVLEIRLYELYDIVDNFILYESTRTHRGKQKMLFYNEARNRYQRFENKIIHFVEDDEIHRGGKLEKCDKNDCWSINLKVWTHALKKYLTMYPDAINDENTLVISGDLDEIPSRETVIHLKYCEAKSYPISGNIIFNMYSFDWLFSDPNSITANTPQITSNLHYPVFSTFKQTVNNGKLFRERGNFPLLPFNSGSHMTDFGGVSNLIYKHASSAEGGPLYLDAYKNYLLNNDYNGLKNKIDQGKIHNERVKRLTSRCEVLNNVDLYLPWIVKENMNAYKSFFPISFENPCDN